MESNFNAAYRSIWDKKKELARISYQINPRYRILRNICRYSDKRVLDCGCGQFSILENLESVKFACGIDISFDALKKGSGYAKVHGNILKLPIRNQSFDVVICMLVLEYIEDDLAVIREISDCLKQGGECVLVVTINPGLWGRDDEMPPAYRRYAIGEVKKKAGLCGFHVRKAVYWGFPFYRLYRTLALRFDWWKGKTIGSGAVEIVKRYKLFFVIRIINLVEYLFSSRPWGIEGIFLLRKE